MKTPRRAASLTRWVVLATVVAGVVGAAVYALRLARPGVTVTEVVEGPAVQAFYATGTLEPADREHPLRAAAAGYVQAPEKGKPYIDKGTPVRKGEVLAVVFDQGLQYAYDKAVADATEKRARADDAASPVLAELDAKASAFGEMLKAAEREFERYGTGIKSGAATQADYDKALDRLKTVWSQHEGYKAQRQEAKLKLVRELAEAESALKIATWNLEQMKVVSPTDGFVLDKPQQVGSKLAVNDLVVTVANTAPANLVMRAQVDEEDVTKVWQPGQAEKPQVVQMSLYAFADRPFRGRVTRIYPKADPERRTFEVDVAIDEPSDRMQAGMTGELMFVMAYKPKASVLPSQALQDGKFWVVRDGKLTAADAEPGLRDVQRVEVASGLRLGDRVVISPVGGLAVGQSVRVAEVMDPAAAAAMNKPKAKDIFRGGF